MNQRVPINSPKASTPLLYPNADFARPQHFPRAERKRRSLCCCACICRSLCGCLCCLFLILVILFLVCAAVAGITIGALYGECRAVKTGKTTYVIKNQDKIRDFSFDQWGGFQVISNASVKELKVVLSYQTMKKDSGKTWPNYQLKEDADKGTLSVVQSGLDWGQNALFGGLCRSVDVTFYIPKHLSDDYEISLNVNSRLVFRSAIFQNVGLKSLSLTTIRGGKVKMSHVRIMDDFTFVSELADVSADHIELGAGDAHFTTTEGNYAFNDLTVPGKLTLRPKWGDFQLANVKVGEGILVASPQYADVGLSHVESLGDIVVDGAQYGRITMDHITLAGKATMITFTSPSLADIQLSSIVSNWGVVKAVGSNKIYWYLDDFDHTGIAFTNLKYGDVEMLFTPKLWGTDRIGFSLHESGGKSNPITISDPGNVIHWEKTFPGDKVGTINDSGTPVNGTSLFIDGTYALYSMTLAEK